MSLMTSIGLYVKVLRIIESCKTADQLEVANKIRLRANTTFGRNRAAVENLRDAYYQKLRELEPPIEPFPGWSAWAEK